MDVQEMFQTPNRDDQKRTSPYHIIIKMQTQGNKHQILKTSREKCQLTYKGKHVRITSDHSIQTLETRKAQINIFQALKENNC
jgi:hypothetical protein